MGPPLESSHVPYATFFPKHHNFLSPIAIAGASLKRPPLESDRDHFLGWWLEMFWLLLTSGSDYLTQGRKLRNALPFKTYLSYVTTSRKRSFRLHILGGRLRKVRLYLFIYSFFFQWNLICDRQHLKAMTQAVFMAGLLCGLVVYTSISDYLGGKFSLFVSLGILVSTISFHIVR